MIHDTYSMVRDIFYKRLGREPDDFGLERRKQDVLYDKKWKIFLRRARLFRHIPFVEFVLAAGSMALGNVNENSDFDVIVGTRKDRIYTTRFFCVLTFGALKMRRKKLTHNEHAKDKICLNHFVTSSSYTLSPPYNIYWKELYKNLVPLFGSPAQIEMFWEKNDWAGDHRCTIADLRYKHKPSIFKKVIEFLLSGSIGSFLESRLRTAQIQRIEYSFKSKNGFLPRIIVADNELEFHPDTKRIYELTKDE